MAEPTAPPLTLYTRAGCHLCAEAKAVIQEVTGGRLPPQEVDVDSDPELRAAYGEEVPVVFVAGHKAFKYRVDPRRLSRLLRRAGWL